MSTPPGGPAAPETNGVITVRYWAAARSAAGTEVDTFPVDGPVTLADVLQLVRAARPAPELERVLGVCSILVGDRPAGSRDPGQVPVRAGDTVELLPPFAGG